MIKHFAEVSIETQDAPGFVRCVFPWEVEGANPEADPEIVCFIEVTAMDPMPEAGWSYDPASGFTAPPEPEPIPGPAPEEVLPAGETGPTP